MKKILITFLLLVFGLFIYTNAIANDNKVYICHRTHSDSNQVVIIKVDANSLKAHLSHGDLYSDGFNCFENPEPVPF